MPLQKFPLLQDNTRLIRFKDTLYKVKVKYKLTTFQREHVAFSQNEAHDEVEQTFRAVLYLSERNQTLKTIATPHFLIRPFKIPWSFPRKCSDHAFQQNGKTLKVFNYMFEFHVSKRDCVEDSATNESCKNTVQSADRRLDVKGEQNQDVKVELKEAVMVVTDLECDGNTRFGRTKDGQLYRINPHNVKSEKLGNDNREDDSTKEESREKRLRSVNKEKDYSQQYSGSKSDVEKDNGIHIRKSRRQESVVTTADRYEKPRKQAVKTHGDTTEVGHSESVTSKTSRDKFSLKKSELSALKRENVQQQRLRSRKSPGDRNLAHSLTENANMVDNIGQGPEADRSKVEHVNREENVQGYKLTKSRNEKIRRLENDKSDKKHMKQTSRDRNRELSGRNKSKRINCNKLVRLKNRRRLRSRYGTRNTRSVDTSSQSETETEEENSDYANDNERKFRNNQLTKSYDTKNARIKEQQQWRKTRYSDRLQNISKEGHRKDSKVENDMNENARSFRHSPRQETNNSDSSMTLDDTDKDEMEKVSKLKETTKHLSESMKDKDINASPGKSRTFNRKRKSETFDTEDGGTRKRLRKSSQKSVETQNRSFEASSDSEMRRSPRETRRLQKDTIEISERVSEEESHSVTGSQESGRSRKVKLYASKHSPQVVGSQEISSPRVSTVLPVKRNNTASSTQSNVTSPRLTRQSLHDDESRRIQSLREERPTQVYKDIMLAQGKDRHLVEQAENAETDKLRQLYEPTMPRRSPRLSGLKENKKRRSSGLWGKIMETLVTPTKKYMFGNRK